MGNQGSQDEVKGMEKITTKPGQAPVAHFVSGLDECEKKIVVWEVQNIAELMKMSAEEMKDHGITFDAGHSIGIPATWNCYFSRSEGSEHCANYLKLSPDSKANLVKASCMTELYCEDEYIGFAFINAREFKNPSVADIDGYLRPYPVLTESEILEMTENAVTVTTVNVVTAIPTTTNLLKAEDVISDFSKLLESEDGADVEVSVPKESGEEVDASSYTRKVHKTVLMARSTVFSKMFAKESKMVEAKTGKVVIEDMSPQGLDIFLNYLYTGQVSDEWLKIPEEILNCAEKYDLGKLKQYCGHNLIAAATPRNAIDLYKVAKLHKLSFAKCAIAEFIAKNLRAVLDDGEEPSEDEENAAE